MSKALAFGAALVAATFSPPVRAEEVNAKPLDVSFDLAVVSDYRFRGVSLSNEKIAVQPGVTLSHKSGLSLALWGSNIAANSGDDIEVDVTLGYEKSFGKWEAGLSGVAYLYPGASSLNYGEGLFSLSRSVGKAKLGGVVAYAPKQKNIGNQDNLYLGVTGEIGLGNSPVSLNASFGIENGAFGNAKRDWSAGASADLKGFTVGAKYVDTARSGGLAAADATIVFSISKSF